MLRKTMFRRNRRIRIGVVARKMILFKPYHAKLILEGKKTQTRRLWRKPRVKIAVELKIFFSIGDEK